MSPATEPPRQRLSRSSATDRRTLLKAVALAGGAVLASPVLKLGRCRLFGATPVEVSTRAVDLVLESTVVDMLGLVTLDWDRLFQWQRGGVESFGEADYRQLERAGIDVLHPAVETSHHDRRAAALDWIYGWNRMLDSQGCFLEAVASIADLERVPARGKIGLIIGFQNADHFTDVADVLEFYDLGQRVSQLTYNRANSLGGGCYDGRDHGLTPFGVAVVEEMNRIGMAIDLSHCGPRTTREAIDASRVPVLVTHSNCQALVPGHPRCKSDELIRALAARGGVIGITAVRGFVRRSGAPTLDDLLDHFVHAAEVGGVEHVGLGSDLAIAGGDAENGFRLPSYAVGGLDPQARVFQIADGLLRRGFSTDDARGILGGNFVRALRRIWLPDLGSADGEEADRRDPFCPAPHPLPPGGGR